MFKEKIFNDFIRLNRGFDLPDSEIEHGEYPVVASTSIKARHKHYRLKAPGVVTGRSGSLGTVQYITENYWPLNTSLYVKDFKGNYPKFVYYFLQQMRLENFNSGAGVPSLNQNHLHKVKVLVPDINGQKKVAAILAAYDDLIDNNQRRIVLLEKMAEEIYREWFVRLRFPEYENIKVTKGVPEGWSFDKGEEFIDLVKGKSYAGDELTDDITHMPFINLKSFKRGGGYRANGLKYYSGKFKSEQVVKYKDVVMAVTDMTQDRVIIGQVARIPNVGEKGAVISLDTVKLVPKNIDKTFLYAYMRHSGFSNYIKEFANGANVLHLKPDLVTKQYVIIPPKELQVSFAKVAEPLYDQLDLLAQQNELLAITRDSLLPRLISGKLSVEHLDIKFPPSMLDDLANLEASHEST